MTDQEKDEVLYFAKKKFEETKSKILVHFTGNTPKKQTEYLRKLSEEFDKHAKKLLSWKEELDTVESLQKQYFKAANSALEAEAAEVSSYVALVTTYQKYFTDKFSDENTTKLENWEQKNKAHEELIKTLTKSYEAAINHLTLSRATLDNEFSDAVEKLLAKLK